MASSLAMTVPCPCGAGDIEVSRLIARVQLSNAGRWMLHCHIAEHLSAHMMMGFTVQ